MMRRWILALVAALLPHAGAAQDMAALVADRVRIEGDSTLVAEGHVEAAFQGTTVTASRITYDRAADSLLLEGPITLRDEDGRALILADQAALDADLQNGLLTSARLVLDRQLQLAAAQVARVGGRYTRLDNTVASSCEVCAGNPTPTWEIRAARIIHDRQERQLYFSDATFRLLGLPVAYFPRLRLPDPTLDRASGFLLPRVRITSQLGFGLKLPYFYKIGDHADLTLTPYLSPQTRTLEARYRQAFRRGEIAFEGAVSRDSLIDNDPRYYVFGTGGFDLPQSYRLGFDLRSVSDRGYLIDYGYSDLDRLANEVRLSRARRQDLFVSSLTSFETLREVEAPLEDQLPGLYGILDYERRIPLAGGEARLGLDAATIRRRFGLDGPGRDVDRLVLSADWMRSVAFASGALASSTLGVSAAGYGIDDDSRFDATALRVTPVAALELRWPLARYRGGVSELLEPVAQIAWSSPSGDAVPNEDSTLVAFDEGNLLSLSRFPGEDATEDGVRANVGLRYTRLTASGNGLDMVLGRIFREGGGSENAFANGTGLEGGSSDWLAATQLRLGDRLTLSNRALFNDGLDFALNEARITYRDPATTIASTYLWEVASAAENRPDSSHELTLDAARRLSRHWIGKLEGRFDLTEERAADAGLGLEYRSECLSVDVSLSRRFTSSDIVEPSTDFGLTLSLAGLGSRRNDQSFRKICRATGRP